MAQGAGKVSPFQPFPASVLEAEELFRSGREIKWSLIGRVIAWELIVGSFQKMQCVQLMIHLFHPFSHLLYRLIFQSLRRSQMQLHLSLHVRQPVWLVLK